MKKKDREKQEEERAKKGQNEVEYKTIFSLGQTRMIITVSRTPCPFSPHPPHWVNISHPKVKSALHSEKTRLVCRSCSPPTHLCHILDLDYTKSYRLGDICVSSAFLFELQRGIGEGSQVHGRNVRRGEKGGKWEGGEFFAYF